jgi:hypothetical protein
MRWSLRYPSTGGSSERHQRDSISRTASSTMSTTADGALNIRIGVGGSCMQVCLHPLRQETLNLGGDHAIFPGHKQPTRPVLPGRPGHRTPMQAAASGRCVAASNACSSVEACWSKGQRPTAAIANGWLACTAPANCSPSGSRRSPRRPSGTCAGPALTCPPTGPGPGVGSAGSCCATAGCSRLGRLGPVPTLGCWPSASTTRALAATYAHYRREGRDNHGGHVACLARFWPSLSVRKW